MKLLTEEQQRILINIYSTYEILESSCAVFKCRSEQYKDCEILEALGFLERNGSITKDDGIFYYCTEKGKTEAIKFLRFLMEE